VTYCTELGKERKRSGTIFSVTGSARAGGISDRGIEGLRSGVRGGTKRYSATRYLALAPPRQLASPYRATSSPRAPDSTTT